MQDLSNAMPRRPLDVTFIAILIFIQAIVQTSL
jgi:hypothetical protein